MNAKSRAWNIALMPALTFGKTIDAVAVAGMVLIDVAVLLARAPSERRKRAKQW